MSAPAIGLRPGWAPGPNVTVDWSHPLAQGLVFFWLASARRDIVRDLVPATLAGTEVATRYGVGLRNTGDVATWSAGATADLNFTTAPFSVLGIASTSIVTGAAAYATVIGRGNYVAENNNQGYYLQMRPFGDARPGLSLVAFNNNAAGSYANDNSGNNDYTSDVAYVLGGSNGPAGKNNYVNGQLTGSATQATVAATSSPLVITTGSGNITSVMAAIWSRQLTPADFASLAADPFQMLRS